MLTNEKAEQFVKGQKERLPCLSTGFVVHNIPGPLYESGHLDHDMFLNLSYWLCQERVGSLPVQNQGLGDDHGYI